MCLFYSNYGNLSMCLLFYFSNLRKNALAATKSLNKLSESNNNSSSEVNRSALYLELVQNEPLDKQTNMLPPTTPKTNGPPKPPRNIANGSVNNSPTAFSISKQASNFKNDFDQSPEQTIGVLGKVNAYQQRIVEDNPSVVLPNTEPKERSKFEEIHKKIEVTLSSSPSESPSTPPLNFLLPSDIATTKRKESFKRISTEIKTPQELLNLQSRNTGSFEVKSIPNDGIELVDDASNRGIMAEKQNKFQATLSRLTPNKSKKEVPKLELHKKHFLEDEERYCESLTALINARDKFDNMSIKRSLGQLNRLYSVHDKLYKSLVSCKMRTEKVAEIFLSLQEDFEVYINFVRESSTIDDSIIGNNEESRRMILSKVQIIRLRLNTYSLALESWMEFIPKDDIGLSKLVEAVDMLRSQCKQANSILVVDSVKKSPYNLYSYLPLIRYGDFRVSGHGFKPKDTYTVLLFESLLLFTKMTSDNTCNCFEALRLEHIIVRQNLLEKNSLDIEVNYSERRGCESLLLTSDEPGVAAAWEADIRNVLLEKAQKIKLMKRISGQTTAQ